MQPGGACNSDKRGRCLPPSSLLIYVQLSSSFCIVFWVSSGTKDFFFVSFLLLWRRYMNYYTSKVTPIVPLQRNLCISLKRLCFFAKLRNITIDDYLLSNNPLFDLIWIILQLYWFYILKHWLNHIPKVFLSNLSNYNSRKCPLLTADFVRIAEVKKKSCCQCL